RYVKKHIYGEGATDVFKTIGRKLFGKTMKEGAKTATKKAVQKAATKTDPKYVERYEDVIFDLETALYTTVANNAHQKKDGYRFVVDNSGEVTPFDWYDPRISLDFKVVLLANGGNIALADHNGIVNGSYSFLKHFDIKLNGKKVYDCNDPNHAVNIKNLLEYSPSYAEQTASNEFFYLDTRHPEETRFTKRRVTHRRNAANNADDAGLMLDVVVANNNKGFAPRKALLGVSAKVNTEIPLNRYSFFKMLEDELLPNTRVEMNFEIESDGNVIWQAGANCRVVITRMQLYVPRITFNSEGQSSYMSQYLKNHKWTYLRENIKRSNSSQQRAGHFRISSGISKPRHVFVFIINDTNIVAQTANPFLYNTFSVHVSTDPRTLSNCHLEVGNGNEYPEIHYTPSTDMTRVLRDVLKYVHKNNEYGQLEKLSRAYNNNSAITIRLARNELSGPHELKPTKTQISKLRKAMSQGTGSDIKISKTQIRKVVRQGGSLWESLISLGSKLLPMAMPLAKKAAAPLVTGVLSGLASLGVDKIFGKGQRGGFLIPMDKIAQLVAYKHLLTTGQKKDILKSLQTGNGLVIRPTKTQQGGFLGTLLASIGIPLLLNALTGKGLQADRTGSANTTSVYVPDTTNGHGMYNPYPYMSPPFFGTWENPVEVTPHYMNQYGCFECCNCEPLSESDYESDGSHETYVPDGSDSD
ncbi:unnamed protein product, partial [Porites evermanni]